VLLGVSHDPASMNTPERFRSPSHRLLARRSRDR
jgi:hypothetical protein